MKTRLQMPLAYTKNKLRELLMNMDKSELDALIIALKIPSVMIHKKETVDEIMESIDLANGEKKIEKMLGIKIKH